MDVDNIFVYLSHAMVGTASFTLALLTIFEAPYGRYASGRFSWGPRIPNRLAWIIQELPAFAIPLYYFFTTPLALPNRILLGYFLLHYIQRTWVFPLLMRGDKTNPTFPVALAFFFCLTNGFLQAGSLARATYSPNYTSSLPFLLGSLLFFLGLGINVHSDHILRNLRKPGETEYKIPTGGLFNYVSGANFTGEILEWTGFALASQSYPAAAFAFFTLCNIGPRAFHHHRYYLQHFPKYPKHRKALLPYLF